MKASSSLRLLCVLCASAVSGSFHLFTAESQRTQRLRRENPVIALILCFVLVINISTLAKACGPETIDPIFVFSYSPDLPFEEFAKGKIGILQSMFGRKTLVIAHRYLGGGTFTDDEQRGLVDALKGKAPEDDDGAAVKLWITARKEVLQDEKNQLRSMTNAGTMVTISFPTAPGTRSKWQHKR